MHPSALFAPWGVNDINELLSPQPLRLEMGLTRSTDGLLTVRFLSDDNLLCQRAVRDIWQFMRPHLTGKSPVLPRIWLT